MHIIPKAKNTLRIVSVNVNGLRAASSKGLIGWIQESGSDIVCMQETRLQESQWLDTHRLKDWHAALFPAARAGYAGTAIYSARPWLAVNHGLPAADDPYGICNSEGRLVSADFQTESGKSVTVASVYFPSGSSSPEAQAKKDLFLASFGQVLKAWRAENRSVILCGDVNIAHKPVDIKNWKANQNNSGFLPHERAWMDQMTEVTGYVDAFRLLNQQPEEYSWWSNRGQAWAKNVGWRIDYHLVSPDLAEAVSNVFIYRQQRFSDHAPVVIDYQL